MADPSALSKDHLEQITVSLLRYCHEHNWAGYDPYDGLNSRLLDFIPGRHSRIPRLVLIQLLKRSPVNFRPLLGIEPTQNPKGIALFLRASLKLKSLGLLDDPSLPEQFVVRLAQMRSTGVDYCSWGYNFPWQTRVVLVPRGAPNLVCTTFVAESLLDAFEATNDSRCLDMAMSAARYIRDDLFWSEGPIASFSYPLASVRIPVHNANFLAASLLCRASRLGGDVTLLEPALRAAHYSASRQRSDGSWTYGEAGTQKWVDNFHTGFNLCALHSIALHTAIPEFRERLERGLSYYRNHFFAPDGAARYFQNRTLPVDAHSIAQSIITLLTVDPADKLHLELVIRTIQWSARHLRSPDGYFYYQKRRFLTVRIPYMRWSEAWMLLALTFATEVDAVRHALGGERQTPVLT